MKRGRKISPHTAARALQLAVAVEGKSQSSEAINLGISRQRLHQMLHPERTRARSLAYKHARDGKIPKPAKCSGCQRRKKLQMHHPDYSKPLSVLWLCSKCHGKAHRTANGKSRAVPTVTFQPTPPNYERLKSLKLQRGACTRRLNDALDMWHANTKP